MTRSDSNKVDYVQPQPGSWTWVGLLLIFMLLVGLYAVSRFSGRWAESDSAAFTQMIRGFAAQGRLIPTGEIYPNGYAFQSISTFILALTGLDVATLQQRVYPLLAWLVVIPAWMVYRELIGNARGATLAVVLLLVQPEFLFVILRSSHEKFTRLLMFLCLFLLLNSFKLLKRPWSFAAHVGLFYLGIFALISTNNLLAHSFIFSIMTALMIGWLLEKRKPNFWSQDVFRRFFYASIISLGLVYLFTFYIYQPAGHDLLILKNIKDQIVSLFLYSQDSGATNPYGYISFGWVSLPVYLAVSAANWIILGVSFLIWLNHGLRWIFRGETPTTQGAWLLWLLYAAFAFQGGLSILVDLSGALGSNLQQRIFPSFSIISVAVIASALEHWRPRRMAGSMRIALALSIFCIAILSIFKATNEPLLSNKWTFYKQSELTALKWTDSHLTQAQIGTEIDERLSVAYSTVVGDSKNNNNFDDFTLLPGKRSLLITQVTSARSSRMGLSIPLPPDALKVYDNGEAALYRLRPKTPYQK